jgi:hypothetical protein
MVASRFVLILVRPNGAIVKLPPHPTPHTCYGQIESVFSLIEAEFIEIYSMTTHDIDNCYGRS